MLRSFLRSKIHRVTVTQSELDYEGSLTLDIDLMAAAGILPYEEVVISNLNNGERFSTYVIEGKKGSGTVCLNGPTARKGAVGDRIIIFSYGLLTPEEVPDHCPVIVMVDPKNAVRERKTAETGGLKKEAPAQSPSPARKSAGTKAASSPARKKPLAPGRKGGR